MRAPVRTFRSRRPKVHIRRSKAGYWATIRGGNGRIVWQTEMYRSKQAAERAVNVLLEVCVPAKTGKPEPMTLTLVDETKA